MTFSSSAGYADSAQSRSITRQQFLDALAADIQIAMADGERVAVMLVDIKKFGQINHSLGYEAGDEILLRIHQVLEVAIKKASVISRLGDNLFGLVIPNLNSVPLIRLAADKVRRMLAEPMHVCDEVVHLDCHIGAAIYPDSQLTSHALLLDAETLLNRFKSDNSTELAIPEIDDSPKLERWKIEKYLAGAVEKSEFEFHFQPKLDLRGRCPASAEALVRWNSTELGFVPPDAFIYVAEQNKTINQITDWAIKTAIRQGSELAAEGIPLSIAVNVSPSDIYDRNLVLMLDSALGIWGIDPQRLTLEITEGVIMKNPKLALANMSAIRDRGIKISIDDFGAGYSSLAYFKSIPADELKIDKSFVLGMHTDQEDAALVELIITLAHKFNLKVVAEGVENVETLHKLDSLGCDYAQGYYISRPLAFDSFKTWLRDYSADALWGRA